MSEWLRSEPAKFMGSARVSSNLIVIEHFCCSETLKGCGMCTVCTRLPCTVQCVTPIRWRSAQLGFSAVPGSQVQCDELAPVKHLTTGSATDHVASATPHSHLRIGSVHQLFCSGTANPLTPAALSRHQAPPSARGAPCGFCIHAQYSYSHDCGNDAGMTYLMTSQYT